MARKRVKYMTRGNQSPRKETGWFRGAIKQTACNRKIRKVRAAKGARKAAITNTRRLCDNSVAKDCLSEPNPNRPPSLAEIALVFLKLGTIAFGGRAAHIAMMEEEFVRRRDWISEEEFLDRLAAANLIPGPSSTRCGGRGGAGRSGGYVDRADGGGHVAAREGSSDGSNDAGVVCG